MARPVARLHQAGLAVEAHQQQEQCGGLAALADPSSCWPSRQHLAGSSCGACCWPRLPNCSGCGSLQQLQTYMVHGSSPIEKLSAQGLYLPQLRELELS